MKIMLQIKFPKKKATKGSNKKQVNTKAVIEFPEDGITVGNWDLYKSIKFIFPDRQILLQKKLKFDQN